MKERTKISGIYAIVNPKGAIYIGQSVNIYFRWANHISKKNYKTNCCLKLTNSLKKYGVDNHKFLILHALPHDIAQNAMNNYESFYYQQYLESGFEMLNLREPQGSRGRLTEEERLNIKTKLTGKPKSELHKQRISRSNKGKVFTEEHRRNIKLNHVGSKGYKHTEEFKRSVSLRCKGFKNSERGKTKGGTT